MNDPAPHVPGRALVWFSRLLGLGSFVLLAVTVISIPTAVVLATGRGDMTVGARLDPPFSVGLDAPNNTFTDATDDGRRVDVTDDDGPRISGYLNFPQGKESAELGKAPKVVARIKVGRDDRDTRALVMAVLIVSLGLGWVATENLRRVVRSARNGQAFDPQNITRLRWAGWVVLAFPIVTRLLFWPIRNTLDTTLNVTPDGPGAASVAGLFVGLGLLALAEVFRAGTDLSRGGSPAPSD